jgi:hypothetical protein
MPYLQDIDLASPKRLTIFRQYVSNFLSSSKLISATDQNQKDIVGASQNVYIVLDCHFALFAVI